MTATTVAIGLPSNIVISSNEEQQPTSNMASRIQGWLGHGVSVVGSGFSTVTHGVFGAIQKKFSAANIIASDAPATAGVFRKLDHHVLRLIEYVNNAPGSLSQFQLFIRRNVAFIDFVQLGGDIHYFATGKFRETKNAAGEVNKERDSNMLISAKLCAFAANIGGSLLWFSEMGFLSLSKAAETIGEVRLFSVVPTLISSVPALNDFSALHKFANTIGELRVFSFVKHTSCLFVTLRALDLMYAFFALDAGCRLLNADSRIKAISAGLELSSYLAELTLSAILMAGVTNIVGLGVVGVTCITLAASSFVYRSVYEKEVKQKA